MPICGIMRLHLIIIDSVIISIICTVIILDIFDDVCHLKYSDHLNLVRINTYDEKYFCSINSYLYAKKYIVRLE
jgi:hypothetical protein